MAVLKTLVFFSCAILAISESRFVDTLSKCSIDDGKCQGNLIISSLKNIHKTGIPELNIPPIDPIEYKDITVSVLDLIELTAVEGTMKGIKNCEVDDFKTEIQKGHSEMVLICNSLNIKAKYKVSGSSPLLTNLFGGESVHGEGNGKVKIEKLKLKFDYFYDMERNKDGEVFFNCKFNKTIYSYEVLGKVTFAADNIFLGETDATELVIGFMNENAKFIFNTFGKSFFDKAMELVYQYTHYFFNEVPAKHFILEDLSQYVKS